MKVKEGKMTEENEGEEEEEEEDDGKEKYMIRVQECKRCSCSYRQGRKEGCVEKNKRSGVQMTQ